MKTKHKRNSALNYFLCSSLFSNLGDHEGAINILLEGLRGKAVINGGRPRWLPQEPSSANLHLIKS